MIPACTFLAVPRARPIPRCRSARSPASWRTFSITRVHFADNCIGEPAQKAVERTWLKATCCWLENIASSTLARKATIQASPKRWRRTATSMSTTPFPRPTAPMPRPEGLARLLPAYAGRTMQAELIALEKRPRKACPAQWWPLSAERKVSSKIDLLKNLVKKVDALVIGGGMGQQRSSPPAAIDVGKSLCEHDLAATVNAIEAEATAAGCALVLPGGWRGGARVQGECRKRDRRRHRNSRRRDDARYRPENHLPPSMPGFPRPIRLSGTVRSAPSRFRPSTWPPCRLPATPPTAPRKASWSRWQAAGDTVSALNHAGVVEDFSYVSTAGGAFLEWMEGKPLPGVDVLKAVNPGATRHVERQAICMDRNRFLFSID